MTETPLLGTWQPFCGAYTAVLPQLPGEETLIIDGPSTEGYKVIQAPRKIRMPGHIVSSVFGTSAVPGLVISIPCDNMTVQYMLGEHRKGTVVHCGQGCPGHDWWEAERWP